MTKSKKKILIINNRTHFIKDIVAVLSGYETKVVDFNSIKLKDVKEFDAVILTGGGTAGEVADSKTLYKNEIEIVRKGKKPVFGICEGFQVVAAAFQSEFRVLPAYRQGVNVIRILVDDPIFDGIKRFNLKSFEMHHIAVKRLGTELEPLAISDDGVEVLKHKDRLIYATQFHPEELQEGNNGHLLLKNFLSQI